VALGWRLGGWRLAAMAAAALGFVLASGYWIESMNTLSLVAVSVPLALGLGLAVGVLAYEAPRLRGPVGATLDVMQVVPTFAYLTPLLLLFGFGPVVGLIASAIYAAPPMARNVLLGLQRVDPETREAAAMAGATRAQRLWFVELPAAGRQIMVGVNQCVMAALSMVIIAAVIGGFDDIGWEVLLTMRKAQFGQSLLAGLVIVAFAILIDRMTAALAEPEARGDPRVAAALVGLTALAVLIAPAGDPAAFTALQPAADGVDAALSAFTAANGAALDGIKNGAMFYGLLPLRIGLEQAVLPFTWGFAWTPAHTLWFAAGAAALAGALALRYGLALGVGALVAAWTLLVGVTGLPWPAVIAAAAALAWRAGGPRLAAFAAAALGAILLAGLWDRAMLSLYLVGAAVAACAALGGALGLLAAVSGTAWRVLRPVCDMLQTIPLFVFLIPALMFFQIGEFAAFLAIIAYAVAPMIRYTRHGLVSTPPDLIEAAVASGATRTQTLLAVRAPHAAPTILLGLNQTILYAFAMLVIAALIGTTGLGQAIYIALGQADVGLGVAAGAAMALLALIADRIAQGFAAERRRALGL
jgi:glycine betaine/proline transport system permease protein